MDATLQAGIESRLQLEAAHMTRFPITMQLIYGR